MSGLLVISMTDADKTDLGVWWKMSFGTKILVLNGNRSPNWSKNLVQNDIPHHTQ